MVKQAAFLISLLAVIMQLDAPAEVVVVTAPGAQVYWEGTLVGSTDADGSLRLTGMPYGRYRVAVQKPGYSRREVTLQVGPGTAELQISLPPEPDDSAAVPPRPEPAAGQVAPIEPAPAEPDAGQDDSAVHEAAAADPLQTGIPSAQVSPVPVTPRAGTAGKAPGAGRDTPVSKAHGQMMAAPRRPDGRSEAPAAATPQQAGAAPSGEPRSAGSKLVWSRWWLLLLPLLLVAWLLWRRRGRRTGGPLRWSPVPQIPRDTNLEAFLRTLSPIRQESTPPEKNGKVQE